jgi:hypothetical protein
MLISLNPLNPVRSVLLRPSFADEETKAKTEELAYDDTASTWVSRISSMDFLV